MIEDLDEQSELCTSEGYCFETISKSLNQLNTTEMIDDELMDSILEERSVGAVQQRTEDEMEDGGKNDLKREPKTDSKNELENESEATNDAPNKIKKEVDEADADNADEDGEFSWKCHIFNVFHFFLNFFQLKSVLINGINVG